MKENEIKLEYIQINKQSSVPLHEQLYLCIKDVIQKGDLRPGDRLPTEDELGRHFQLSRPVIRQAYLKLVNDGLIVRERKRGSFVKEREYKNVYLLSLASFHEEASELNAKPSVKLISKEILIDDTAIHEKMGLPSDELVLLMKRMRYLDSEPSSFIENYISLQRFPELLQIDFSKESLYQTLCDKYDREATKAERKFSARIVPDELALYLDVPANSATFVIESVVYDQYDQILEFSREYFGERMSSFDVTVYKD